MTTTTTPPESCADPGCRNKAKEAGLCGTHLNVKIRWDARKARRDASEAAYQKNKRLAELLTEATGIPTHATSRGIELTHDDAAQLLDQLTPTPTPDDEVCEGWCGAPTRGCQIC